MLYAKGDNDINSTFFFSFCLYQLIVASNCDVLFWLWLRYDVVIVTQYNWSKNVFFLPEYLKN